jgi:alpha-L-fucosidase
MKYLPQRESLQVHKVPDWFHNAKFGIFIHWGLYSVPAWAPQADNIQDLIKKGGLGALMTNNPYAEWYMNSMDVREHPTYSHHRQTYGNNSYYDFQKTFEKESEKTDPGSWADLFQKAGAKYVVMVTKHHDGYVLWPTKHAHPTQKNLFSQRDFVGEVTNEVRKRDMKMGHYYSGVFDWSFKKGPIRDFYTFLENQGQSQEYVDYATAHWYEIIERYGTSLLWNDIGYPHGFDVNRLFSDYYNTIEDGIINDRWNQTKIPGNPLGRMIMKIAVNRMAKKLQNGAFELLPKCHYDFRTPEYMVYPEIREEKWETCRGIGHSFGFNKNETEKDMLKGNELIWSLIDTVSKNGNLLLNVGPKADGTIPEMQQKPLLELGKWLSVNGEAIYDTRPWNRAEGQISDGTKVRFTAKEKTVYAHIQKAPASNEIKLNQFNGEKFTQVSLLGASGKPKLIKDGENTVVLFDKPYKPGETIVLAFTN